MVLSKTEKVNLVKSLSPSQKDEIKKALTNMGGNGIKDVLMNVADTLKPIVKTVGITILKEVLVPALKQKLMGDGKKKSGRKKTVGGGLKIPGGALRLAGQRGKRGSGRPMY